MKILVSVPNTGWIHKHVSFATDLLLRDPRVTVIRPTHVPYENNLAHIRLDVLNGGYDFWLNIDSDNPPIRNPLGLLSLQKPLIGLPTPVWHFTGEAGERPIYWNVYKYIKDADAYTEWPCKAGLQEVDAIGTGCFLVHREVLEAVEIFPFNRQYKENGTVNKGNDISWCERIREVGFPIHAHFDFPCRHFVELELNEVIAAFKGLGVK